MGNAILSYPALYNLSKEFKLKVFVLNKLQEEFLKISGLKIETEFQENFFKLMRSLKNKKVFASTHNLYAPYKKHPFIYLFLKSKIRIGLKGKDYLKIYNIKVPFVKKEKIGNLELVKPILKNPFLWKPKEIKNKKGPLLLFPGSSKKFKYFKRWKFFPEIGECLKKDFEVRVILGPEERELKTLFEEKKLKIIFPKNLKDLISIIDKSIFFIGNDSGISHLASWRGLKGIIIYTSTDFQKNEPLGKFIPVKPVISCAPCYKFLKTKCINKEKYKCTETIAPEDILKVFF